MKKLIIAICLIAITACSAQKYTLNGIDYNVYGKADLNKSKKIYALDLSHEDSIPSNIWQLNDLVYLNLSNCNLSSIPEEVCSLKSLKSLILTENNIKSMI